MTQDPVSFEEFRLYHATTERVTDRRLALNRWNCSILVATLLAIEATLPCDQEPDWPPVDLDDLLSLEQQKVVNIYSGSIPDANLFGQAAQQGAGHRDAEGGEADQHAEVQPEPRRRPDEQAAQRLHLIAERVDVVDRL